MSKVVETNATSGGLLDLLYKKVKAGNNALREMERRINEIEMARAEVIAASRRNKK